MRLAAELCEAPLATLAVVDAERVRFAPRLGFDLAELPRTDDPCARALEGDAPFEVEDARHDPGHRGSPLVAQRPHVAFYAGAPLRVDGLGLGALTVMDTQPRRLTPQQRSSLEALARQVNAQLELRLRLNDQGEALAQAAHDRFRTAFEHAPQAVCLVGEDGKVLVANRAFSALLRLPPGETLEGRHFLEFTAEEDRANSLDLYHSLVRRERETARVEKRYTRADGTEVPALVHVTTLPSSVGAEGQLAVCVESLEERSRAQEELRAHQRFQEKILAVIPDVLYVFDLERRVNRFMNRDLLRDLGYRDRESERFEAPLAELLHPEDRPRNAEHIQRLLALRDGEVAEFEHRLLLADGSWRWFLSRDTVFTRDAEGRPREIAGSATDVTERKRAQQRLQSERDRSLELLNSLPGVFYVMDATPKIVRWNDRLLQATQRSPEDVASMSALELVEPGHQGLAEERLRRVFQGEEADLYANLIDARGETTPYYFTGRLVHMADGPKLVGMGVDISARHLAQQELAESEARYRSLVESSLVGIWHIDPEGHTIYANPAMLRMLELDDLGDLAHETFHGFFSEASLETMRREHAKRAAGSASRYEVQILGRRGAVRDVLVSGAPVLEAGKLSGLIGTFVDLTERKRSEAEVLRLAAFPERNPEPVIELREDASVSYANRAALDMATSFGLRDVAQLLPPGAPAVSRRCLETGEAQTGVEIPRGERLLSWSFYPVHPQGVVHCYVSELTERRQLEAQVRQLQKMESVGLLAAGVAHDFNNLLTVILGHSDLLDRTADLARPAKSSLSQLRDAATRAADLTRQLLLFSRKERLHYELYDLTPRTRELTRLLTRLLGARIELDLSTSDEPCVVHADPGMIDQVLTNLVVNARDAMPEGGPLDLEVAPVVRSEHEAAAHPGSRAGEFVRVCVRDAGQGIDPADLPRIFEPFFTTKDVGKGTGLGLATAFGIVDQHRGWIEVQSQLGEGTCFQVFLPRAHGLESQSAHAEVEGLEGGDETVLVVEDEHSVRRLTCHTLRAAGYTVLEAANGQEALDLWRTHGDAIDLVFTDLVMPLQVSGPDLVRRLRAERPELPALFTSGYSEELLIGDLEAPLLRKPFRPAQLLESIRRALRP